MTLLTRRKAYKPFLYPKAFEYWLKQQQAHWLATEVPLASDLQDWKFNLSEAEKSVIGGILKGFTQTEVLVNDYWSGKVAKWFPHPEIAMAATTMAASETIHVHAYSLLDESLGFDDYEAYLAEPTIQAKMEKLMSLPGSNIQDKALSLAVFSAFTEGVSLFSSFAVLQSFSRFNKLKGVAQIVSWSVRDESLHSEFGCWLFRTLISEYPDIWTDEFKKTVYQAARDVVALEDDFIDKVFEKGEVEGLSSKDLKNFIRNRANTKLGELGLKKNWKNIDEEALKRMEWFEVISSGASSQDFFSQKPSAYSKGVIDFDSMFD
jgi:ribonucleoside-diphosphate reductase beta chain